MNKNIVLIPARGGSKSISNKNLVKINSKPLIYYAITAAIKSKVDEVWVSTEDIKIKKAAIKFGAKVIDRPLRLAKDTGSSESVLLHFARFIKFNKLIFLQATSPLVLKDDINQALKLLNTHDSAITVTHTNQFIWFGKKPSYQINKRKRRQNFNKNEKIYIETGSLFATKYKSLLKSKQRISGKIGFIEVPRERSFDIDNYDDLKLIKKILKK